MKAIDKIKNGARWNGKVYTNNCVYINNKKFFLNDNDVAEALNYKTNQTRKKIYVGCLSDETDGMVNRHSN